MSAEIRQLDRRLRNIEELLEVTDMMNEDEASVFLGISRKTLQNKVYSGSLDGCFVINKIGHRMYSKSKLISK